MDYSDDLCMNNFTAQQANRMRCTLDNWRPNLATVLQSCTSVAAQNLRNPSANPNSLTGTPPLFGSTMFLNIDLTTTGHSQALVIGFNSPANVVLGGGQTLLTNVADPGGELLGLTSVTGPFALSVVPVPTVGPSTCGLEIYAQAIHFGGVVPFALSNALDLTLGF